MRVLFVHSCQVRPTNVYAGQTEPVSQELVSSFDGSSAIRDVVQDSLENVRRRIILPIGFQGSLRNMQ